MIPATLTVTDATNIRWDAVVIGAGPAGAVAAHGLARNGARTLLVDRATFPREKVCGCCLNANALNALNSAGLGHVPTNLGAVPLDGVQLAAGMRTARLRWPSGASVSRWALDAALIREAIQAGVAFLPNTRAVMTPDITREQRVTLHTSEETGTASARVVVIADGLNGQMASKPVGDSRIGAGTVLVDGPDWYVRGTVYLAAGVGGYVGLVRVEDGRLDVAAAFDAAWIRRTGGLGPAATTTLQEAGMPAWDALGSATWKGTPALTRTSQRVAGHGWFVIGDAAGYVEPFTGEGMGWAMASAVAVVPFVMRGVSQSSDELATDWTRTHRKLIRQRQGICRGIAWVLRRPALSSALVRFLNVVPSAARPVVHALHRQGRV